MYRGCNPRRLALVLSFCGMAILSAFMTTEADGRGGKIVVANRASGTISVIDARTDQLLRNVDMPPGDNPPDPMYVVNTPFRNLVWIGDRANNRVVAFRGRNFDVQVICPAGNGVFHMWADALGRQLWVVNDIDGTATVIDTIRLKVLATVPMPADLLAAGAKPHDVMLDPLGFFAYVSFLDTPDPLADTVVQFSTRSFQEWNRLDVGEDPHLSFMWRRYELYMPCQGSNAVFVADAVSMNGLDMIPIPGAHGATMSLDARRFYTTNLPAGGVDALFCIDTQSNQVVGVPAQAPYSVPHNAAITPRGDKVFVTHSGANDKVTIYDTNGNGAPTFRGEVTVGNNPFGLAYVR